MLKFLDTLIKFIIIIIIIIITTFVSFPSFMAGSPEAANHENDVKPTAEEKLDFDDDTLRGERQNNFHHLCFRDLFEFFRTYKIH